MKKLLLTVLLLLMPTLMLAQNPQTSTAPLVGTNSRWVNGVAPGYYPLAGSGLTLSIGAGTSFCATTIVSYAGGTLTLTDNTTNYVYLDTTASCAPASNTTGFSSTTIPVAQVVTSGGGIVSITDDRTFFVPAGTGGTGLFSLNGLTASSQTFATGTSGTDFNIVSSGSIHTFNFPNASASARGLLTSTDWSTFNGKAGIHGTITPGDCASWYDATNIQDVGTTCGGAGSSLFTSFQIGTNPAITGSGKYFQLAAGSNISFTYSGSGTSVSPYIATISSTGGGGSSVLTIANEGTTGTTANTLTKVTGAPSTAIIASTSDTGGVIGITTSGAGVTGNATIQINGQVNCVFDNATTAGDYVQISSTTSGSCHDVSSSYPTSGQVVGRVLSTNASAGTYQIDLFPAEIKPSNLVTSVFGRTGAVAATSGDYTASQVTNAFDTSTNNNIGTHYFDIETETAPTNPSAGAIRLYADSTSGNLTCLTSAGGNCLPSSGGGGNVSTTGTITTGYLPKFASSTTITNSAADDGVTTANTFTYAGSGGVAAPNGPMTSGSPSAAAAAALPSGAHGIAADESSTAGVPAAGVDYLRADSASHCWKASVNGGAAACVLTSLSGFGLFQSVISVPTVSGLAMATGFNQSGTFTITNNSLGVSIADPTSSGSSNHQEGVLMTYPAVAFTATALFSVPPVYANYTQFGILAAQSTTAKLLTWQTIYNSGWKAGSYNFTAPGTSASSTNAASNINAVPYIWLQWKDDGTNLYLSVSTDDVNWQQVYTVAKSSSYLAGNFNYFGIFVNPEGGGFGTDLLSWSITYP